MNRSPSYVIRALLVAENAVAAPSTDARNQTWPCYTEAMPDGDSTASDAVAVYTLPGMKEGRQMTGEVMERFACQIKVRAADYTTGWQKMAALIDILDDVYEDMVVVDTSYRYLLHAITRGVALALGPEIGVKRRFLFTVNFSFVITENP